MVVAKYKTRHVAMENFIASGYSMFLARRMANEFPKFMFGDPAELTE